MKDTNSTESAKPLQLGFLGVGWIGRNRMETLLARGIARALVIADTDKNQTKEVSSSTTSVCSSIEEILSFKELDGIVIATPSALHATQACMALNAGIAVFCQKPLGRTCKEVIEVIDAASKNNRLLGVDFSYRHLRAAQKVKSLLSKNTIGKIFAVDATFHNAYGPDKPWFYDPVLSGGGCVIDLGIHLVDLILWLLDFPDVINISSRLFSNGVPLKDKHERVEDYATARLDLDDGVVASLSCSWKLPAGKDAEIGVWIYGTDGAVVIHNVEGSFYDFVARHCIGTKQYVVCDELDTWGGRAIEAWAEKLSHDSSFDNSVRTVETVSRIIDSIYSNYSM